MVLSCSIRLFLHGSLYDVQRFETTNYQLITYQFICLLPNPHPLLNHPNIIWNPTGYSKHLGPHCISISYNGGKQKDPPSPILPCVWVGFQPSLHKKEVVIYIREIHHSHPFFLGIPPSCLSLAPFHGPPENDQSFPQWNVSFIGEVDGCVIYPININ